jgi:hypothetical protein
MIGQAIKVITDEMITPRLADGMHLRGHDVSSCHGEGRANRGISDADQLAFATAERRAIYTFNAVDFRRLHAVWQAAGREHAGTLISEDLNGNLAEMIRRLQLHMHSVDVDRQHNRLWLLRP